LLIGFIRYDDKLCPTNSEINYLSDVIPSSSMVNDVNELLNAAGITIDFNKDIRSLNLLQICNDNDFREYLNTNGISFHPCLSSSSSSSSSLSSVCQYFIDNIAPPTEQQHLANYKEFIGAFSPHDIAHHVSSLSSSSLYFNHHYHCPHYYHCHHHHHLIGI